MDMTPEQFDRYIKATTTLEQRIAYVENQKEKHRQWKKELLDKELEDNWRISEEWYEFKQLNGLISNYHNDIGDGPRTEYFTVKAKITPDIPPYHSFSYLNIYCYEITDRSIKEGYGKPIMVNINDLIQAHEQFLTTYEKHCHTQFGVFYTPKKISKKKPQTSLF